MTIQGNSEVTIQQAITCICQLEHGLNYVIKNTNDKDDTKEVLILIKEFANHKADMLEQELAKLTTIVA